MTHREPCGSLPIVSVSVSAHYCEHHQAWSASAMSYTQTSDEEMTMLWSDRAAFGPFDDWRTVEEWCVRRLEDITALPT